MTSIPIFSGEISLYDDPDEGLRVECAENYYVALKRNLVAAGFKCGEKQIRINGNSKIHSWIEFGVSCGNFGTMKQTVSDCLKTANIVFVEESLPMAGEMHVRLNLTKIGVAEKK